MTTPDSTQPVNNPQTNIKPFAAFSAIAWSLLIFTSISWNLNLLKSQAVDLATLEARANWNKDLAFRRWATRHGGFYVKPDTRTPPNPYLSHIPHRDVITTKGIKLTLMNPAYMMSQLTTEYEEMYGIKGSITGQVLLNPANKADAWELAALKKFDTGKTEVTELSYIRGEAYLRFMKPVLMEEGCVLCHGHLGFKIGDIRGGVSVSIPLTPYIQAADNNRNSLLISHSSIWLLGLIGIFFLGYLKQQKILQQQVSEKALDDAHQEWVHAMDFFDDAIYLIDLDDKVVRANQAFYNMMKLSPEQVIGQSISKIIHPQGEDTPCPLCVARQQRRDEIITMEADNPDNPSGKPIEATVRIIRDNNGSPLAVLMGMHDLSRNREASEAIYEREQQISDLLRSTAEGIYSLDIEGKCVMANPSCAHLLGYDNENELIGKHLHEMIHHSHVDGTTYDESDCLIYQSFRSNTEMHVDNEVFWRADGSNFPAEYWAYPILRKGKVIGTVVTFFDITEELKTEQALRRSQKMDALGQLTGGIAHDFNNQLGIVSGYMELLEDFNAGNEKTSQWLAATRKATTRCITLTRQLLNFSRQQQTNTEIIDLKKELDELDELIRRTLTPAIDVSYDIDENLWSIATSRGDLEDALLNLIINARDAMPDGGRLAINMYNKVLNQDEIVNEQSLTGDYVLIVIEDSGQGISLAAQEHIFDPFFSTKEVGKGTGLGMSMVYAFVKRSQGLIKLYSEPGLGTSIKMYFPRTTTADSKQENTKSKVTKIQEHNKTILVVEDEIHLKELAVELLGIYGYNTLQAEDGEAAIKIIRSNQHIDLLFSDIVMPGGMNGYQLASKARELRPDLKIQLTSGLADKKPANERQAELGLHFLQKPYTQADLINCVNKFFE
jgi:two-component system, cell cycle sensor histidine kinase and response regulator CckA